MHVSQQPKHILQGSVTTSIQTVSCLHYHAQYNSEHKTFAGGEEGAPSTSPAILSPNAKQAISKPSKISSKLNSVQQKIDRIDSVLAMQSDSSDFSYEVTEDGMIMHPLQKIRMELIAQQEALRMKPSPYFRKLKALQVCTLLRVRLLVVRPVICCTRKHSI